MTTTVSRRKSEPSRGVSQWALAWRRLKKNKVAIAGLGVVGLFALFAAFDGWPFVLTAMTTAFSLYIPQSAYHPPVQVAPSLLMHHQASLILSVPTATGTMSTARSFTGLGLHS